MTQQLLAAIVLKNMGREDVAKRIAFGKRPSHVQQEVIALAFFAPLFVIGVGCRLKHHGLNGRFHGFLAPADDGYKRFAISPPCRGDIDWGFLQFSSCPHASPPRRRRSFLALEFAPVESDDLEFAIGDGDKEAAVKVDGSAATVVHGFADDRPIPIRAAAESDRCVGSVDQCIARRSSGQIHGTGSPVINLEVCGEPAIVSYAATAKGNWCAYACTPDVDNDWA